VGASTLIIKNLFFVDNFNLFAKTKDKTLKQPSPIGAKSV